MKIGIQDSSSPSLVLKLISEGHSLVILVEGVPPELGWNFKNTTYVGSKLDLVESGCDFIIANDDLEGSIKPYCDLYAIPCVGHSQSVLMLEYDRNLAEKMLKSHITPYSELKIVASKEFTTADSAINFLKKSKIDWVAKQHANSPLEVTLNRTVVSKGDHSYLISLLKNDSNQFFKNGYGGVRLEQFVEGDEIAFGAFFNGRRFSYPIYAYHECKDAQDGNKSGILTGEVGSEVCFKFEGRSSTKVGRIFESLEEFLPSDTTGMIDINTIVDKNGDVWFLEFTNRWGRPALEFQIANSKDLGEFLYRMSYSYEEDFPYIYKYASGPVVFNYGYPLYTAFPKMSYKPPKSSARSKIEPFITDMENNSKGIWATMPDDPRHFVSIGLSNSIEDVKELSYKPLKNFRLQGATWRNDIGDGIKRMVEVVEKWNLL